MTSKVRVFANLELGFELPEDSDVDTNDFLQRKERKLLRLLRRLADEDPEIAGALEGLEFEGFVYDNAFETEASGYYHNKHDDRAGKN